jgi:hypothetical protein
MRLKNLLKDTYNEVNGIGDRLFVIDNKNIVRLNIVPEGENPFHRNGYVLNRLGNRGKV